MVYRVPPTPIELPQIVPLAESRIVGGMNSYTDPADLPNGIASKLTGADVKADYTMREPGRITLAGTDPDGNPVLLYTEYSRFDGTNIILRFSRARVDKYSSGTWTAITGTLSGTDRDRIRFVTTADAVRDYFIFTNNGADNIKVLNTVATSFANLGNAGRYKYIVAFFNRIVAANKVDAISPNPILLAWSGDFNFTEWNPLTDISAGSNPLQESQADYADPITGLFAFASVMLILRERSLWIATKRPVASNPFAFQAAFNYVGCDCPGSATQTRNGITWYDRRTNQAYSYQVGSTPQEIGSQIKDDLAGAVTSNDLLWGSYDMVNDRYILTIPSTTTTNARIFRYHFPTQSWTFSDVNNAYGYYPIDGGISRLTYDQLTGTYDQLTAANATYDAIGLLPESPPVNHIGFRNGSIQLESPTDTNAPEFVFESKVYRLPKDDIEISGLMLLIRPIRDGSLTLEYRKNGRNNWVSWKTLSFTNTERRVRLYADKLIAANEFQWRIRCTTGQFQLMEYRLDISVSPEDKNT